MRKPLLIALVLLGAMACSPVLEPVEEVELSQGLCGEPSARRIWRFRFFDEDFGMAPPEKVSVPSGTHSTVHSYVSRSVDTGPADPEHEMWVGIWPFVHGFLLLLLPVLLLVLDGVEERRKSVSRKQMGGGGARSSGPGPGKSERLLVVALAVTFVAYVVVAFWSGSRLVIDNPAPEAVRVSIDGGEPIELPGRSFYSIRVRGLEATLRASARVGEKERSLETVRVRFDEGLWQPFWRHAWSRGEFVYSLCGLNEYSKGTARYGPGS